MEKVMFLHAVVGEVDNFLVYPPTDLYLHSWRHHHHQKKKSIKTMLYYKQWGTCCVCPGDDSFFNSNACAGLNKHKQVKRGGIWHYSCHKAADTTLFNSTKRAEDNTHNLQQLSDALNKDLQAFSECGSQWLVSFNSSQTQSTSCLNQKRSLSSLQMSCSALKESKTISLLGLTSSSDLPR